MAVGNSGDIIISQTSFYALKTAMLILSVLTRVKTLASCLYCQERVNWWMKI